MFPMFAEYVAMTIKMKSEPPILRNPDAAVVGSAGCVQRE
jgi:hypothetical protein